MTSHNVLEFPNMVIIVLVHAEYLVAFLIYTEKDVNNMSLVFEELIIIDYHPIISK